MRVLTFFLFYRRLFFIVVWFTTTQTESEKKPQIFVEFLSLYRVPSLHLVWPQCIPKNRIDSIGFWFDEQNFQKIIWWIWYWLCFEIIINRFNDFWIRFCRFQKMMEFFFCWYRFWLQFQSSIGVHDRWKMPA